MESAWIFSHSPVIKYQTIQIRAMKLIVVTASVFFILPYIFLGNKNVKPTLAIPATAQVKAYRMINEGQALLQEGDLVVRLNQDPSSQFIKNFNRQDKSYSHSGIVLFENGFPYVYHIVNGNENPDQKLRKDSLLRFCNPRKNFSYGIYRYKIDATEKKKLKEIIHSWYTAGVRFDSSFNLKTDDRMYCSEMIKKGLARATNNRINIETTQLTILEATALSSHIHLPISSVKKLQIIAIDNLYRNANCTSIRKFNFCE